MVRLPLCVVRDMLRLPPCECDLHVPFHVHRSSPASLCGSFNSKPALHLLPNSLLGLRGCGGRGYTTRRYTHWGWDTNSQTKRWDAVVAAVDKGNTDGVAVGGEVAGVGKASVVFDANWRTCATVCSRACLYASCRACCAAIFRFWANGCGTAFRVAFAFGTVRR